MLCSTLSSSSSSTQYYFSPQAGRPNTTRSKPGPQKLSTSSNPRKNSKLQKIKTRNRTPPPSPPPRPQPTSAVPGGEATTYTCLPPKDDVFLDDYYGDIDNSTIYSDTSQIVTLSEFTLNKVQNLSKKTDTSLNIDDDDVQKKEKSGFDYGKFELYEVNDSDLEQESEDDFDENSRKAEISGFEEDDDDEDIKEKEKGVPAVMRCFDRAKIFAKAGDGGNGVVAFRREKFVPLGGPSGGDGGKGGNVYVEVDGSMNSLLPFRQSVHYRAGRGSHGQGSKQNGARGEDVVVKVPPGTVIKEAVGKGGAEGDVLLELLHPGQRALLLPGGRGGRGNASFKSGMNKVPRIAENGEEGLEL